MKTGGTEALTTATSSASAASSRGGKAAASTSSGGGAGAVRLGGVGGKSASGVSMLSGMPQYLRRIFKWRQMDVEYTFWQMLYLCVKPRVVYRHTSYHKQTKNQWARDDPAFLVITSGFIAVASTAYCVAYGSGVWSSVLSIVSVVLFYYIFAGCCIATICWAVANRYMRPSNTHNNVSQHQYQYNPSKTTNSSSYAVEQSVEWLYAFDVHCNAYFPMFIIIFVLQFFLSPVLLYRTTTEIGDGSGATTTSDSFVAVLLSNVLFLFAGTAYHYVSFLGYNALPFLDKTEFFLYPIGVLILAAPISILMGFNPTRFVLGIFF